MGDVAKGIKSFKKGMSDNNDQSSSASSSNNDQSPSVSPPEDTSKEDKDS